MQCKAKPGPTYEALLTFMDDLVYGSLFHYVLAELNVPIIAEYINRGKNAHTYCEKREGEKEAF